MEQTRVYQNQPTHQENQPDNQSPANPNLPVQFSTHSTPKTPSESAVRQKTRLNQNVKKKPSQNRSKPDDMDQNWIDEDQSIPTHRALTGFDGNGAIWVTEVTEQPGFLFPVARTTTLPTIRRQITEEASLSATPHQVVHKAHFLFFSMSLVPSSLKLNPNVETNSWHKLFRTPNVRSVFYLQSSDHGPPDQAGDGGLPSPQSDLDTPPVEDIQVTDVFYEDTVNNSPLETTNSAATVPAATVLPGHI